MGVPYRLGNGSRRPFPGPWEPEAVSGARELALKAGLSDRGIPSLPPSLSPPPFPPPTPPLLPPPAVSRHHPTLLPASWRLLASTRSRRAHRSARQQRWENQGEEQSPALSWRLLASRRSRRSDAPIFLATKMEAKSRRRTGPRRSDAPIGPVTAATGWWNGRCVALRASCRVLIGA